MKLTNKPIYILTTELAKIEKFIELAAKFEISGLGIVTQRKDMFLVEKIYLPKQTNTSGNTTLDEVDLANLPKQVEKDGYKSKDLRFWWHSHSDMDVFWSDEDNQNIKAFFDQGFLISSVFNNAGETLTRLDIFVDEMQATQHKIPLRSLLHLTDEDRMKCEELYLTNVDEHEVTMRPKNWHAWSDYDDAYDTYKEETRRLIAETFGRKEKEPRVSLKKTKTKNLKEIDDNEDNDNDDDYFSYRDYYEDNEL